MYRIKSLLTVMLGLVLVVGSQVGTAQGNSEDKGNGKANASVNAKAKAKGFGKSQNIGVGNASDGIKGRILTDRGIFYMGDPLEISVIFPRGAELITSGDADAYVVVFAPIPATKDDSSEESTDESTDESSSGTAGVLADAIVLPVSNEASEDETVLFSVDAVDVGELPVGTYQLGLILTNPGGDPLVINDWYGGLLGLEHVRGLTVAAAAVDFDEDGDGEVDDDSDEDGFSDDNSATDGTI